MAGPHRHRRTRTTGSCWPDGQAFPLRAEWLDRVKLVDPRVQGVLLGADYVLPIRIGDLPASATPKQLHYLRLKSGRDRRSNH